MSGMYELRANAAYIMLKNPIDTTTCYLIASMLPSNCQQCQWHNIWGLCLNWRGLSLLPIPWMDCCFHCLWAMPRCGGFKQVPETSRLPWRCPQRPWSMAIFFFPAMWMCFFLFCSKGGKWTKFNRVDGKDGSKRAFWRTTLHHVVDGFGFLTFLYVHTCLGRHSQLSWKKLAWAESSTGLSGLSFLHFRWISFPVAYISC